MSETTRAAWDDRNALARQCADLRDEADDLRREIERLKDHISIIDDDRRDLCDELEKATGRDWTAEQARSWLS
jgi:cell division protein FtsB